MESGKSPWPWSNGLPTTTSELRTGDLIGLREGSTTSVHSTPSLDLPDSTSLPFHTPRTHADQASLYCPTHTHSPALACESGSALAKARAEQSHRYTRSNTGRVIGDWPPVALQRVVVVGEVGEGAVAKRRGRRSIVARSNT